MVGAGFNKKITISNVRHLPTKSSNKWPKRCLSKQIKQVQDLRATTKGRVGATAGSSARRRGNKIDPIELCGDDCREVVGNFIAHVKQHGPPKGLPPDMRRKAAASQAMDLFLSGCKNRRIQDHLQSTPPNTDAIRDRLRHVPASTTDPPAYSSGPTAWLCSQLRILDRPDGVAPWARPLHTYSRAGRTLRLAPDADEHFQSFLSAVGSVHDGPIRTLRQLVDRSVALGRALAATCHGMGSRYVPMRQVRGAVTVHGPVTDFSGVSVTELRAISPDKTGALDEERCKGRNVEDVNWYGVQPQHWTLWVCLFRCAWSHERYFKQTDKTKQRAET